MGEVIKATEKEEVLTPDSLGGLKIYRAESITQFERALVYGPPSIGKTPLIASADNVDGMSPMLIINVDKGAKSLRSLYPHARVVDIRNFSQLQKVFDQLHKTKGAGFKSVCVDGVTTAQVRGIEHLYYSAEGGRNTSFTDFKTAQMQNGGWSTSATQMGILFDAFTDLPMHVFMTAWSRNVAKPKTNKMDEVVVPSWVPDFTPAALNKACGAFDSILYMYYHEAKGCRVLQSKGTPRVMARDRGDRLPDTLEDPTMREIAKHWGLL